MEDGSRYWFPVSEVERFLRDMEQHGRDKGSETIGQGSDAFAAEILAGALAARRKTSETTASSAIEGEKEPRVSRRGLVLNSIYLRQAKLCHHNLMMLQIFVTLLLETCP